MTRGYRDEDPPSRKKTGGKKPPRPPRRSYDPELFYPLEGKAKRARFGTIDLESKDGASERKGFTRVFLAGLYDGKRYQGFTNTNDGDPMTAAVRSGGCLDRLMAACLGKKYSGWTFYCHNGGGFDFLHLLPLIMRLCTQKNLVMELVPVGNSRLLSITLRRKGQQWGGIKFVDSLRTVPMGLDKAGKAFELGGKNDGELLDAQGRPFTLDTPSQDPAWLLYNERDLVLLYEVMEKAHDMVENEFGGEMGLTAPATAMKTFRRGFLHESISRDTHTHAFIREGYFGGRTERLIFEGSHLSYYDVNSSYPHAMTKPMPMGEAQVWGSSLPPLEWRQSKIGFCRVTVRVPDDIELPPLPVRADGAFFPQDSGLDGKLLFPTGILKGVWEWEELENALSEGCEVLEWHESVWYRAGPLLAEFVEVLYRYRDKSHCYRCRASIGTDYHCAACAKVGYSPGLDAWAKLILNATYGKFGQRAERLSYFLRTDPNLPEGSMPLVAEDPECPLYVSTTEVDSPFIMPQIAARVTAIGRVTLYRAARQVQKSVVRECWRCHSKVTYRGELRGKGWVLGDRIGGSGSHGDEHALVAGRAIGPTGSVCPCGGCIENRKGRVFYMDTDSLLTDAHVPTSAKLGGLKDEVPRFSGFLHGRFYASKMYALSVEPSWCQVDRDVRRAMMLRDGGYLAELGLRKPALTVEEALEQSAKEALWTSVRSKGLSKKNRTAEVLELLYEGALKRLEWHADPKNQEPDGSVAPLPEELENLGTVMDERLEQFGTLAGLVERDRDGEVVLYEGEDGYSHVRATPFARGPRVVQVPRRLHLGGSKRELLQDGTTRPYSVDMSGERPKWWVERELRRARLRAERSNRPASARVGKRKAKGSRF